MGCGAEEWEVMEKKWSDNSFTLSIGYLLVIWRCFGFPFLLTSGPRFLLGNCYVWLSKNLRENVKGKKIMKKVKEK